MNPVRKKIWKWKKGEAAQVCEDELAPEEPLEIRVQNRGVSVTLRTSGHDQELAAGFLLTEGLIRQRSDVLGIEPCVHASEGDVINVQLSPGVAVDFDRLTRHVFTSSSCGLCGKASIDAVRQQFPPVRGEWTVCSEVILSLPDKLRAAQETFDRTGGLHAAGLFDPSGQLLVLREDVGRHNAVDKVLGRMLLDDRLPLDRLILMVSGRTSFEILQKALAAGIAMIAAVSAPSSLAAEFAEEAGQTLVGFLREGRMNVYTNPQRIQF